MQSHSHCGHDAYNHSKYPSNIDVHSTLLQFTEWAAIATRRYASRLHVALLLSRNLVEGSSTAISLIICNRNTSLKKTRRKQLLTDTFMSVIIMFNRKRYSTLWRKSLSHRMSGVGVANLVVMVLIINYPLCVYQTLRRFAANLNYIQILEYFKLA